MGEKAPLSGFEAPRKPPSGSAGQVGFARDRLKSFILSRKDFFDSYAWLALVLAIPAMLPLLAPGYFLKAHDARHSIYFLVEFDQVFREGALWPVWAPDQAVGFGYPLWLVYAPLAYFAAEAFHLLGLGYGAAAKATWALGFIVGALGAYRLARRWWGPAAGLVASVAFTYAPYHLVQIYVRAALAEFMALAWLPWAVLALASLWEAPRPRRAACAAAAIAVLLLLHTVSMLTFVPLLAGLVLVFLIRDLAVLRAQHTPATSDSWPDRKVSLLWTAAAAFLGGLLASIFMIPMLLERRFIVEAQWVHATYNYRQHFVYLSQFFDPKWGYGYSVPGIEDGMSFQLGPLIFLAALIGSAAGILGRRFSATSPGVPTPAGRRSLARNLPVGLRKTPHGLRTGSTSPLPHRAEAGFLALASAVALFLMTPASAVLWDTLPLIALVQFPWRLLAVEVFTLALLAGAGAAWLERSPVGSTRVSAFAPLLALGIMLASFPYTQPQLVPVRPQDESPRAVIEFELEYSDMRGMTAWSERLPLNTDSPLIEQYLAGEPLRRAAIVAGPGEILAQEARALGARVVLRAAEPVRLRFYTYYFPGWRATLDGQPVEITHDPPNGLIGLDVPAGEHEIVLRFGPTPVRRLATVISLVTLVVVACLALLDSRR
ncbi:MAG: hypothetical protein N2204_05890 [Anaerolineae bacterium]|nr:hypothetical protein [Anaerolineae bacterium]